MLSFLIPRINSVSYIFNATGNFQVSLAQKKEIVDLNDEKTRLLSLVDDLRVKEAKGEECAQALAAARSQLGSMVQ